MFLSRVSACVLLHALEGQRLNPAFVSVQTAHAADPSVSNPFHSLFALFLRGRSRGGPDFVWLLLLLCGTGGLTGRSCALLGGAKRLLLFSRVVLFVLCFDAEQVR